MVNVNTTGTTGRSLSEEVELGLDAPVAAAAAVLYEDSAAVEVEEAPKAKAKKAKAEVVIERPSGNAKGDVWRDYRLANGYTEEELEGKGRNELRDLEDR